jgi:gas vesicle protein
MADDAKFPYFLLGLGLGFVGGLLLAPRSGEETIGYLKERAGESREYLRKQQDTVRTGAEDLVSKGRTAVDRQRERIAAAYESGKQAYKEAATTNDAVAGDGEAI